MSQNRSMASLSEIVSYTDRFLRIHDVGDWDNALNGLQIENSSRVTRLGAAVDVSTRVLTEAAKKKVNLLIVHHGLFWAGLRPVRNALRRKLKLAFENDIALYSAHLPLDSQPKVGNNAQLVAALFGKLRSRDGGTALKGSERRIYPAAGGGQSAPPHPVDPLPKEKNHTIRCERRR